MDPYAALKQLQLQLPPAPAPGGNYGSAKTTGSLVFLAGVISHDVLPPGESSGATDSHVITGGGVISGTVGDDRSVDEGYRAARCCALLQLAVLEQHLGSLSAVKSIVSVNGYVNSVGGFADSPKVINGASDLLMEVFGEAGRHVRAAIGVSGLPRHALVELQMIVEIAPAEVTV